MGNIFSRRQQAAPDTYQYDVPEKTRFRIIHCLRQLGQNCLNRFDLGTVLHELGEKLLVEYGGLQSYGPGDPMNRADDAVLNHFLLCNDEMALDFIELFFQCFHYSGDDEGRQRVNSILHEDGIGFELTPFVQTVTEKKGNLYGRPCGNLIEYQYPKVVKKDSQYMHQVVVRPCLELLSDPKFKIANQEMLKAHEEYRDGKYADAITDCGSAFETVMKTICREKGWSYSQSDTCAKLIAICKDNKLFPPFYVSFLEGGGTIRNKLGDAHGKGPTPEFTAEKEHFEHLVQTTSANILLLVRLAKL